ncbi:MAG: tetratricopeptide repeat protein [Desulfobacterales bacterium]|nr:tetratricopeptide repeat protein [Desulfobacterales bacterium]
MKKIKTDHPGFHLIAILVIVFFGAIVYTNTLNNPFVFDDAPNILENQAIRVTTLDFSSLYRAATEGMNIMRPLGFLSFALNYYFGGYDVAGYHVVNIVIHLINGALVYFIALLVFGRLLSESAFIAWMRSDPSPGPGRASFIPLLALFSALIFTVHPIQTQAVSYIVQRYTSMVAMFYMGALLFYMRGRIFMQESESGATPSVTGAPRLLIWSFFALAILCGAMALMSKQSAASLPLAILLVEYLLFDRTWKGWKRKLIWMTPVLVLFLLGVVYMTGVLTADAEFSDFLEDVSEAMRETGEIDRWSYLCTQFNVLVIYLRMMILPIGQSLDHLYPFKSGFFDGFTPAAFALLAMLAVVAVWSARKRPIITFSIAWFFITLSVESSIFPISDAMFEHRMYPAMLGFALFLGHLPVYVLTNQRMPALVLACAILLSLGISTYMRNRVWRDKLTLWTDVLAKNPENHRANSDLGITLFMAGEQSKGVERLHAALALKPNFALGHFNLGRARELRGDPDGAAQSYSEALRINSRYMMAHMNLGVVRGRQGRYEEAVRHFKRAIKIAPRAPEVRMNLGMALSRQGKEKEAIAHYRKALELNPDSGVAHYYLGLALAGQGDSKKAEEHFYETLRLIPGHPGAGNQLTAGLARQTGRRNGLVRYYEAVRAAPGSAGAHYNLAVVLAEHGKRSEAARHYLETIRIDPGHAEAHSNLGVLLARANRLDEAIIHFNQALMIKPDSAEVHTSMGGVQHLKRNFKEAIEHYTTALRINPGLKVARENLERLLQEMRKPAKTEPNND